MRHVFKLPKEVIINTLRGVAAHTMRSGRNGPHVRSSWGFSWRLAGEGHQTERWPSGSSEGAPSGCTYRSVGER